MSARTRTLIAGVLGLALLTSGAVFVGNSLVSGQPQPTSTTPAAPVAADTTVIKPGESMPGYDHYTDPQFTTTQATFLGALDSGLAAEGLSGSRLGADDQFSAQLTVDRGELVCEGLDTGVSPAEVTSTSVEYGGLTQPEAELLLAQAVVSLCPEHMATLTEPAGITDGMYIVGTDIEPGTYRSAGPGEAGTCFFFLEDEAGNGIDSGATEGPAVVTVPSEAYLFETSYCQPWTAVE